MSDLIERLEKLAARAYSKDAEVIQEAITALSPALPDDVAKAADIIRNHWKNHDIADLLERQAREIERLTQLCITYQERRRVAEAEASDLQQRNDELEDPDWKTYIALTEKWLEKYPASVFDGSSGDPGPLFVVALRNALAALAERNE